MNTTETKKTSNVCHNITQIETDLESTLNKIFAQAGSNIKIESKEKYTQEIANTKQVFAKFKSQFGCLLNSETE